MTQARSLVPTSRSRPDTRLTKTESGRVSGVLASIVLVISGADFAGWWMHIPLLTSAVPHYATMKPNTALCLLLVAVSALVSRRTPALGPRWRVLGEGCAAGALLVSGLSLAEYATQRSFGIDQLLSAVPPERFADPAGRMSLGTSVCLVLTSLAYLLLDRYPRISIWSVLLSGLVSVSGLTGFIFQAGPLIAVPWLKSLAVHTALSLLFLQFAALALRPEREPYRSLTQNWQMEHRRRYLLPAITLLPVLLTLPILWGLRLQHYDAPFAMALLVVFLLAL